MNSINRPYDIVLPGNILSKVQERRRVPDGRRHFVTETQRGSIKAYRYPFDKMELGDYFLAPIGSRSKNSMRIAFYQAAARLDIEIAVTDFAQPDGSPGFRVTKVLGDVNAYKRALDRLLDKDELLPVEQQRYRHIPRPRYSDLAMRRKIARKQAVRPLPKSRQAPAAPDPRNNPFWADEEEDAA